MRNLFQPAVDVCADNLKTCDTQFDEGYGRLSGVVGLANSCWSGLENLEPRVLFHADVIAPDVSGDHHHHADDPPAGTIVHPDNPAKQDEHEALLGLVQHEDATHVAIADGLWSDADTWLDGIIPTVDADVLIPEDHTVIFDSIVTDALHTIRIDGELEFVTDTNTFMLVDTFIVSPTGTITIGTEDNPIAPDVNATIVIADTGEIDLDWDPTQLSRGFISHGAASFHGAHKTPYAELAELPRKRSTEIVLTDAPEGWQVGDRIVITGTSSNAKQDEEVGIAAIDGNRITLDEPLRFHHNRLPSDDLSVYVANVSRNVVILSENPYENDRRGHAMFMHSDKVEVHNTGFYGLGRTDKRTHIDDPVFDDHGELIEGTGTNVRGRYAAHFHRNGADGSDPAVITGSVVVDSPGWGFVNHDSHVIMEDNVSFDVVGAHFVTEFGNEIGAFRRNLAIRSTGSGDGLESREEIFDLGHGGHGFWMQGPGVELEDNIAAGHRAAAFIFFTRSAEAKFDAHNLLDPSIADGKEELSVGSVPIFKFEGNVAYASRTGLETWFHLLNAKHDQRSVLEDFTVYNTRGRGVHIPYTNQTTLRDVTAYGNTRRPGGTGVSRNNVTNSIHYENMHIEGFSVGIDVARNGASVIEGGFFNNVINIRITTASSQLRTVDINGDIEYGKLTEDQLNGRTPYDVQMKADFKIKDNDISKLFSPDIVRLGTIRFNGKQVYYHEQAADFVPFKSGLVPDYVPKELIDKTNTELFETYGLAIAGAVALAETFTDLSIDGLIGDPTEYPPQLKLRSRKFTNQLIGYRLSYNNAEGERVRETERVDLRAGWNLLTREIDGQKHTFLVYGDVEPPTFVPDPARPLVINPKVLKNGFLVKGKILDNSFGMKNFKKKFSGADLKALEVHTREDGSQFVLLEFTVKDKARNTTDVVLELTLDDSAPLNPLGNPKDLPEREVSRTLVELLAAYTKPLRLIEIGDSA